jgi:hypothetical protein
MKKTRIYLMKPAFVLCYILLVFITIMIFTGMFNNDVIRYKEYDLITDGCCVMKNVISKNDILTIKKMCDESKYEETKKLLLNHQEIKKRIVQTVDENYVLQDYIWIIKKSAVHTCHRDNNGDFFNKGQQYPSYTMLVYIEDMEKCLGVIPTSHRDINAYNINFANNVENVICNKGDAVLFNANLIHVGAINEKDDNLRIQLKVTHKEDIQHIAYYQNFNKVLNEENKLPKAIIQIQKNISCMLPFISDLSQRENINSSRGSVNGSKIGYFQKVFSYLFYGNSDFYDLPNAF